MVLTQMVRSQTLYLADLRAHCLRLNRLQVPERVSNCSFTRTDYFIAIPWGRPGPVAKAVSKFKSNR
jgi:hypothetical protein